MFINYMLVRIPHSLSCLRYWIPDGRQLVKKAVNHCVTCKITGLPYNIPDAPSPYPKKRLTQAESFTVTTWTSQELYTSMKQEPKRKFASLHVLKPEQSSGRKNVMSILELFCPDPLARF